jgi:competence protein ComGC
LISLTTQTLQGSTIPNRFLSKILELYSISQIQNPSSLTDLKSSSRPIKSQSHCFNEGKGRRRKRGGEKRNMGRELLWVTAKWTNLDLCR